jgi:hypothetical protein
MTWSFFLDPMRQGEATDSFVFRAIVPPLIATLLMVPWVPQVRKRVLGHVNEEVADLTLMVFRRHFNCSISMVIFTNEHYLAQPFHFSSLICPIQHQFVFLRSGTGVHSRHTFTAAGDINFTAGRIIRVGFNDSELFALSLTLYFPTALVLAIDFDRFRRFDPAWIDLAVGYILEHDVPAVAACVLTGVASHALLTRSSLLRRFLLYTDVRYSKIPAMAMFSRWAGGVTELAAQHWLSSPPSIFSNWSIAPMHCPFDAPANVSDVVLIIPSFKRDYMYELITAIVRQTHPPCRIFILQNCMHVLLNFSTIMMAAKSLPVFHVWCTNWNSFFFLTYSLMMFVPERFVIKIDDDNIPIDPNGIATFVRTAMNKNVIVGRNGLTLSVGLCGIHPKVAAANGRLDHVAWVVLFNAQACKIMNRFRWYSLLHAEDVAISVANAMECGTSSVIMPFAVHDYGGDRNSHKLDGGFRRVAGRSLGSFFLLSYCHIIQAGYRPVLWTNFTMNKRLDIRLPH